MRALFAALLVSVIACLAAACGSGGGGASFPPTPDYSTEQVVRAFKEHGIALRHMTPIERQHGVRRHLKAVLQSDEAGPVAVFIYTSSEEARLVARALPRRYGKAVRFYRFLRLVNVVAVVPVLDRAGLRALKKTQAALADLGRI